MNLRKGSKVWFEDSVWVTAQVLDSYGDRFLLATDSGKRVFATLEKLFPREADEDEHARFRDLTMHGGIVDIPVSNEEANKIEVSKLQKMLDAQNLELDEAKLATINERVKNAVLQNQLELTEKEKSALKRDLVAADELQKENDLLKVSLDTLEKKYATLELELMSAQKGQDKCLQLTQNVQRFREKLLILVDENLVLHHLKAFSTPLKSNPPCFAKSQPKGREYDIILPYWLSNISTLLCLLQRNLSSNGFLAATAQHDPGLSGLISCTGHGPKSPFKFIGYDDAIPHVEMRYPAVLFKQYLTACVKMIFGLLCDNLKKELLPLLGSCIQVSQTGKGAHGGKLYGGQWKKIVNCLDSLMIKLRGKHVPSFFIRKLVTQVFSFINITLFNSLLLRRECCTFSNGECVKSGLAELEKWIVNAKEEYAGTSWHELNYIRQAVEFLVIHQKRKKSLEEIRRDICPALTMRQIYRISTMYWDDKYGTQSVSNEVASEMRAIVSKDSQNLTSNSFLLDDDESISFFAEDIDMAIPAIDSDDIDLPEFVSEYSCAQFLSSHQK